MKQFILALAIAALCFVGFRALAFTVYVIDGTALEPELMEGDRIIVNRWSYGLRTGDIGGLFRYGRLFGQPVGRGDIVAFDSPNDSIDGVFVCRCKAVAGDTLRIDGATFLVPGRDATCADEDYYWMEAVGDKRLSQDSRTLGPVPESCIIGRVCLVLYSRDPNVPIFDGFRTERTLLAK